MQLFELIEQFYATLLLQDDQVVKVGKAFDIDDEDDAPTSLLVRHVCIGRIGPVIIYL